ncbi:uncharacterized protein LOC118647257 [Monomorium pharaonis]|uniref:uncharacterized protein LOC118647257 n=1 Tax=Monomorium pharaonis TaxID=307658 RepID=UPI00174694BE|nr:uncharacterized protein LOC118647257 [Monomorium pharaonis]
MFSDKKTFITIMSNKKVYQGRKRSKYKTWCLKKTLLKRPLNHFEAESSFKGLSASAKKLKLSEDKYNVEINNAFGYRFINFMSVMNAISQAVVCRKCGTNVTFTESVNRGLGFKIVITCKQCDKTEFPNSSLIKNAYEINRRFTLTMRLLNVRLNGIKKFCAFMDLPRPIYSSFYNAVVKMISKATKEVRNHIRRAEEEEKAMSIVKRINDGITVLGDESWRKRGFSSLYGIVSLIGWLTVKIVDIEVKSKYYKVCEFWQKKEGTAEHEEWFKSHKNECQCNHKGSAGKMEIDAVVEMFQRSEHLHNVKYVNYVGDGDSKIFKGILDAEPYNDISVQKRNAFLTQKRMGTRLRNFKKNIKGLGGKEKLTGKLIDELSVFLVWQ